MTVEQIKKLKKKIYKQTKNSMETVGTFRPEFDPIVERYAELRAQFQELNDQWYEDGCKITEDYTNKAGATNKRKTALYLALETLRKELADMENLFGLTPKGLKGIKRKGLETGTQSKLDSVLEALSNEQKL